MTAARATTTWKVLVEDAVRSMPRNFTLGDLLARREWFAKHYPRNRFVDAKLRQTLQILRDQGVVTFAGGGHYQRTADQPAFSPLIHPELATNYKSGSQIARVVIETWAEMNLYCLNCRGDSLSRHPANKKTSDFFCGSCQAEYQVKAKNGRFGGVIGGAHYTTTLGAVERGEMPEHVLVEYDLARRSVVFVDGIPGKVITADRIVARAALSNTAKRSGWQGCNINVTGLERTVIVAPAGVDRSMVREAWLGQVGRPA